MQKYDNLFNEISNLFPHTKMGDIAITIRTNKENIKRFSEEIKEYAKNTGAVIIPVGQDIQPPEDFNFTTLQTPYGTIKLEDNGS